MSLIAIVVVLLLVVLNGVFAMSELAVVSSRKGRLQALADGGDKAARVVLDLAEHPTRFLSAVQIGITLIGILAGAYGQATIASALDHWLETAIPPLAPWSEAIATGIVVVLITYISLVIGELVPKRLALLHPEPIARLIAPPLSLLAKVLKPFVMLLTASTGLVLRIMGVKEGNGSSITSDEVELMLAEGADAGLIEPEERTMIQEVMRLGDRPVRVAMTPRRDIFWVSLTDPAEQVLAEIRECPYSRIVVALGSDLDGDLAVVMKKDLLDAALSGQPLDLKSHLVTPIAIPDSMSLLRAMAMFKQTPMHIAFVVDEFGSLEGVVTAIDLLEMIAGDFNEAHDDDDHRILRREDGSWLVDGRVDIQDLRDALGRDFDLNSDYHTAAGLILDKAGRIPSEGEIFLIDGYDAEVIDMDGTRIDKLLFKARPDAGSISG
ncbi:hemolysin family protein [Caulobacter mirabilis]|uniref:Hemolysin n=1 Tax=Caulobacter mirabilis TaxID=69666 RepID=A0A2D2B2P1_9CAUL|nr:hemolysin family protein [Caulobacter mirabilis]ATQ44535.1 hypothetical protein CSW64_20165 [Caulobacter mirabilis]